MWPNIGLHSKITEIRTAPDLISYPKTGIAIPKTGVLFSTVIWRFASVHRQRDKRRYPNLLYRYNVHYDEIKNSTRVEKLENAISRMERIQLQP